MQFIGALKIKELSQKNEEEEKRKCDDAQVGQTLQNKTFLYLDVL